MSGRKMVPYGPNGVAFYDPAIESAPVWRGATAEPLSMWEMICAEPQARKAAAK